jgi:hypothetical protein
MVVAAQHLLCQQFLSKPLQRHYLVQQGAAASSAKGVSAVITAHGLGFIVALASEHSQ